MSTSYPDPQPAVAPQQSAPQYNAPPPSAQYPAGQPPAPQYGAPQHGAAHPAGYGAAPGAPAHGDAVQPGFQGGQAGQTDAGGGLAPNVAGLLAYITWIGGLAMYLTQKHREVRFHAAQSILFSISLLALWVVLWVGEFFLTWIFSGFGFLTLFLFPLVGLGTFVLWVILAIRGYNLVHFKLPVIGDMAEKWADK